jgi:DNA-binding MarR family transcriptional regulator
MKLIKSSSYIRFLACVDGLDRMNLGQSLDSTEEQMLNYLSLKYAQGQETLVGDVIHLDHLGSQATLHGRLKKLVAMGYVVLVEDKSDARKKAVMPTAKARKYYDKLSSCLEQALKNR